MSLLQRIDARSEDGMTLVELLLVLVFMSVLFSAFALLMTTVIRTSDRVQRDDIQQTEVRSAVDRLAQDLREAYSSAPITSVSGTQLVFLSPDRATAADGSTPFHLRKLTYTLAGGSLSRTVQTTTNAYPSTPWDWSAPAGPSVTQVGSVVNAVAFTTVDPNTGNCTTTAATSTATRTLCVTLSVGTASRPFTYTTTVYLRDGQ